MALSVKEGGDDAHGNIIEEGGKPVGNNASHTAEKSRGPHKAQRIFAAYKMGQRHAHANRPADGRGKACAKGTHIQRENEKPVAHHVENAAGEHRRRGADGIAVISEKGG